MAAALLAAFLQVEVVAHRGSSEEAPENTLAAFRLGWQHADACELDIYLTRDGKIAVIHDGSTKRTGGLDKPVAQQTLDELQKLDAGSWKSPKYAGERIPSLSQVLEALPEKKRLYIEIKCGTEVLTELRRVIDDVPAKKSQLSIIGFGYETMVECKKLLPSIPTYLLADSKADKKTGKGPDLDVLITKCKAAGLDGLDLHHGFPIDKEFVAKVHGAGLKLLTWTVNDPKVARAETEAGVDGITTDKPAAVKQELSVSK